MTRLLHLRLMPAILAFCLGSGIAAAQAPTPELRQSVLVLSGEHVGFTRLAMVLPGPGGWRIEQVAEGYALRLERPEITLDTSRIFDLVPRDRLSHVTRLPDGLLLGVSCDCHVRSFEDRPGVLVIDIVTGPPPQGAAQTPRPMPRPEAEPPSPATFRPAPARTTESLGAAQAWIGWTADPDARPSGAPTEPDAPSATNDAPDTAIQAARHALFAQVGRAASQDLLRIALSPAPGRFVPAAEREVGATSTIEDLPSPNEQPLGISVETAFDRTTARNAAPPLTATGFACVPDERLDLAGWAAGSTPWASISTGRAALLGEFDTADATAIDRHVRAYLHLGFGAEARATLAAFPDAPVPDRELLVTIAAIVDDQHPEGALFDGMTGCDSAAALWAVLAAPEGNQTAQINTNAVLRAYSALPSHLREVLGHRLVERLLSAGESAAARSVAAALARTRPEGRALDLIEARLQMPDDATGAALRLSRVALGNDPESAEALILLVETELSRGRPVSPETVEALAAKAFELRGSVMGDRLAMAYALALGANGDFDAAFHVARTVAESGISPGGQAALTETLWRPLLKMLTSAGDDASFLRHTLDMPQWRAPDAPLTLRLPIARRLLDLGMAELALAALPERARVSTEEKRLRAEALLLAGNPAAALPLLAGDQDEAGTALRARALVALGDAAGAAAALRAAGSTDGAAEVAWRQGDTDLVREFGTDLQRQVATPIEPGTAVSADGDAAPLARGRALIEESVAFRATVDLLLQETSLP